MLEDAKKHREDHFISVAGVGAFLHCRPAFFLEGVCSYARFLLLNPIQLQQQLVVVFQVETGRLTELLLQLPVLNLIEDELEVGHLLQQQQSVYLQQGSMRQFRHSLLNGRSRRLKHLGLFVLDPPLDLADEFGLLPEEVRMIIVVIGLASFLGEAVHIELPYIRMHVLVLEVGRQDIAGELLDVLDDEAIFLLVPSYGVAVFQVLRGEEGTSNIQQVLMRKGGAFLWMDDMLATNYIIIFISSSPLAPQSLPLVRIMGGRSEVFGWGQTFVHFWQSDNFQYQKQMFSHRLNPQHQITRIESNILMNQIRAQKKGRNNENKVFLAITSHRQPQGRRIYPEILFKPSLSPSEKENKGIRFNATSPRSGGLLLQNQPNRSRSGRKMVNVEKENWSCIQVKKGRRRLDHSPNHQHNHTNINFCWN